MKHHTQGVVLSYIKYAESSIIVRIYTASFGLQSYLVRGVRRSGNKSMQIGHFYPLVPLEMVVSHKPLREIQHIQEVQVLYVYRSLPFVLEKQPYVSLFCGLLQRLIAPHDELQPPDACFSFVLRSCYIFDQLHTDYTSFGVQFLAKLSYYVGIGIQAQLLRAYTSLSEETKEREELVNYIMQAYARPYGAKNGLSALPWGKEALRLLLNYYQQQWLMKHNSLFFQDKAHPLIIAP